MNMLDRMEIEIQGATSDVMEFNVFEVQKLIHIARLAKSVMDTINKLFGEDVWKP